MSWHRYWTAFKTILTKEILRFMRIWVQTVLPPIITTMLYYIIFGSLIGERIGEMDGIRYLDFIVPGLILMAVITNSYSNVFSSFYSSKFERHLDLSDQTSRLEMHRSANRGCHPHTAFWIRS